MPCLSINGRGKHVINILIFFRLRKKKSRAACPSVQNQLKVYRFPRKNQKNGSKRNSEHLLQTFNGHLGMGTTESQKRWSTVAVITLLERYLI